MKFLLPSLILLPAALPAQSAQSDMDAVAPDLIERHAGALVGVEGVLSLELRVMGQSQQQEQEVSTSALVISEEGHLIASLSSLDPSETMNGRQVNTPAGPQELEVEADLGDLRIVFQDGLQYSARAILRDDQSDLILLLPDEEEAADHDWNFVPIDAGVGDAGILDELLLLGRFGPELDRSISATRTEVEAVVERPRTLYVPNTGTAGQAVFNAAGELLGLTVQQLNEQGEGNLSGVVVVQPARELQRLLDQANEASQPATPPSEGGDEAVESDAGQIKEEPATTAESSTDEEPAADEESAATEPDGGDETDTGPAETASPVGDA